jgi:hypothetical protein
MPSGATTICSAPARARVCPDGVSSATVRNGVLLAVSITATPSTAPTSSRRPSGVMTIASGFVPTGTAPITLPDPVSTTATAPLATLTMYAMRPSGLRASCPAVGILFAVEWDR